MDGISVIICCYNSARRIEPTLNHLLKQKVDNNTSWEVVLVDNNSTDDTASLAARLWGNNEVPIRIVKEENPGLAHARVAGVKNAQYDFIVFCDDDNWLCDTYINTAYRILQSNTSIGAVGGQGIAAIDQDITLPEWFSQRQEGYAVGRQAAESGDVTESKMYLWGAGITLRKKLFNKAFSDDFPSLMIGRKGEQLSAGDDAELCMRLIIMGYRLYYEDTLIYHHYITSNRLTEEYYAKMSKGFEQTFGTQTLYSEFIHHFIFKSTNWGAIVNKLIIDIFKNRDFRFARFRRFLYWKWGLPTVHNQHQKLLRRFYLSAKEAA